MQTEKKKKIQTNYFRLAVQSEPFLVVYEYRILLNIGRSSLKKNNNNIFLENHHAIPIVYLAFSAVA